MAADEDMPDGLEAYLKIMDALIILGGGCGFKTEPLKGQWTRHRCILDADHEGPHDIDCPDDHSKDPNWSRYVEQ